MSAHSCKDVFRSLYSCRTRLLYVRVLLPAAEESLERLDTFIESLKIEVCAVGGSGSLCMCVCVRQICSLVVS